MRWKRKHTIISTIAMIVIVIAYAVFKKRRQIKQAVMKKVNNIILKTWDKYTNDRIQKLHPKIRAEAAEFIDKADKQLGIKLRIVSGLRTWEEQAELYAQGRTKPGEIVTKAKPGQSYHNYGLAIDVVEIKDGKALWDNPLWDRIGALGETLGFEWGGSWTSFIDRPHFQMNFGKHHTELSRLYQTGERDGEYVRI